MAPPTQPPLYTIQPVAGKGLGVIASQNIPLGTRIISEAPILTFSETFETEAELHRYIMQKVNGLSPEHRAYFYTLHHHGSGEYKEWDILETNSLPTGVESLDPRPKGIYLDACRINHDCRSNAVFNWNENLKQITVHAVKDIKKGGEITISYNYTFEGWEARQQGLCKHFGFRCSCDTCSLPLDARSVSDQRLINIHVLKEHAFNSPQREHSPIRFFQFLVLLLRLLGEEGLFNRSAHWVWYFAFETSVFHGDIPRARIFAKRAATSRGIVSGEDDPDSVDYRAFSKNPKTHDLYEQHGKYMKFDDGIMPRALSGDDRELWLWRDVSFEVATRTPKVACFAAGLRIEPFEKFPSNDASKPILDADNFGIVKQPVAHWCFIGEIASIEHIGTARLFIRDKTGSVFAVQFHPEQLGRAKLLQTLQPGRIIAFLYAERLVFENGVLGIRVKDISLVKTFQVSLFELYGLCRETHVYTVEDNGKHQCRTCGIKSESLQACGGCRMFWFCSKRCQKIAWNLHEHKALCKRISDPDLKKLLLLDWENYTGDRLKFPL